MTILTENGSLFKIKYRRGKSPPRSSPLCGLTLPSLRGLCPRNAPAGDGSYDRIRRDGRRPHVCSLCGAFVRFRAPPVPESQKMLRHCSHFLRTLTSVRILSTQLLSSKVKKKEFPVIFRKLFFMLGRQDSNLWNDGTKSRWLTACRRPKDVI